MGKRFEMFSIIHAALGISCIAFGSIAQGERLEDTSNAHVLFWRKDAIELLLAKSYRHAVKPRGDGGAIDVPKLDPSVVAVREEQPRRRRRQFEFAQQSLDKAARALCRSRVPAHPGVFGQRQLPVDRRERRRRGWVIEIAKRKRDAHPR
jgi:hypothetical protein